MRDVVEKCIRGCSTEIILLSLVVLSIARVRGDSQVKIVVNHHGRDYPPGAADVVGFFTDFRTVLVPTSKYMSLLGVINFVRNAVLERRWRRPEVLEPIDIVVNIVPSLFGSIGCLTQTPWESSKYTQTWYVDGSLWQSNANQKLYHLLEFQIEQVDVAEWNVMMYLDKTAYPYEQGSHFRSCWRQLINDIGRDALLPVTE